MTALDEPIHRASRPPRAQCVQRGGIARSWQGKPSSARFPRVGLALFIPSPFAPTPPRCRSIRYGLLPRKPLLKRLLDTASALYLIGGVLHILRCPAFSTRFHAPPPTFRQDPHSSLSHTLLLHYPEPYRLLTLRDPRSNVRSVILLLVACSSRAVLALLPRLRFLER
jgi:hypothetical protein